MERIANGQGEYLQSVNSTLEETDERVQTLEAQKEVISQLQHNISANEEAISINKDEIVELNEGGIGCYEK